MQSFMQNYILISTTRQIEFKSSLVSTMENYVCKDIFYLQILEY